MDFSRKSLFSLRYLIIQEIGINIHEEYDSAVINSLIYWAWTATSAEQDSREDEER